MIIFYYGTDLWRLQQQVRNMKDRYRAKYASGMNLLTFDFTHQSGGELRDAIRNVSFFDEVRLCILHNVFLNKESATNLHTLIEEQDILKDRTTVLLCAEPSAGPDLKKIHTQLYALLTSTGTTKEEYVPLAGAALTRWVNQQCSAYERTINPDAISELITRTGNDSWTLSNELSKLANFCSKTITLQAVKELVPTSGQENVFALTDALGDNNRPRAFSLLYQQLAQGTDPYGIFGAFVYHIRNLLATKQAEPSMVAKKLAVHPFVAQKAARQAKRYTANQLSTLYQACATLDHQAKEGIRNLEDDLYAMILAPE